MDYAIAWTLTGWSLQVIVDLLTHNKMSIFMCVLRLKERGEPAVQRKMLSAEMLIVAWRKQNRGKPPNFLFCELIMCIKYMYLWRLYFVIFYIQTAVKLHKFAYNIKTIVSHYVDSALSFWVIYLFKTIHFYIKSLINNSIV